MSTETKEKQMSEQDIQKAMDNYIAFYEKQIPFLTKKKEYQALLTEIAELELRELASNVRAAQLVAPPPNEPDENVEEESKKQRRLSKRD